MVLPRGWAWRRQSRFEGNNPESEFKISFKTEVLSSVVVVCHCEGGGF
jgi:hypothetical protein